DGQRKRAEHSDAHADQADRHDEDEKLAAPLDGAAEVLESRRPEENSRLLKKAGPVCLQQLRHPDARTEAVRPVEADDLVTGPPVEVNGARRGLVAPLESGDDQAVDEVLVLGGA